MGFAVEALTTGFDPPSEADSDQCVFSANASEISEKVESKQPERDVFCL